MMTYRDWFEIAATCVRHYERSHWLEDGLARKAALAAVGKSEEDGIAALVDRFETGMRCFPFDDPHDEVALRSFATVSVLAPVSDPNTLRSPNLSPLTDEGKLIISMC